MDRVQAKVTVAAPDITTQDSMAFCAFEGWVLSVEEVRSTARRSS